MGIVIGVDIGSKHIKLAAVEKKKAVEVKWVDCIPTPEKSLLDGELIHMEEIMYVLADYFSKFKIKKVPLAVCISASQMGTKQFEIPHIGKGMLDKAVQLEFYNQLGLSVEEYSLSYRLQEKSKSGIKGVMAYCPHKTISDYKELFKWAELNLKYIDMNANCISKFYNHLIVKQGNEDAVMLIDIGTDTSHISIVKDKALCMSRSVVNGGNDLDQIVAMHLGIDLEEANRLKHDKYRTIYEEGKELEEQMKTAYSGILREIDYTIGKFQEEHQSDISKLLLLGGGSNLPGMSAQMKRDFNKPTQLVLGGDIKNSFISDVHLYANAIGAAIREA